MTSQACHSADIPARHFCSVAAIGVYWMRSKKNIFRVI
jgi:hypothetical protein